MTGSSASPVPETPQGLVEVDGDAEHDSTFGDGDDDETETLQSWITDYQFENGRRYHAYGKYQYWGSNDEAAIEHMDLGHMLYTQTFGGELFMAPINQTPFNILDLGTGTGSWAIDVADTYPTAVVIGTDLSPIQPTSVPPNCEFQVDDMEHDFSWNDNYFDYIHLRGLHGTIRDWPRLYRQCLRVLKPGGYMEQSEYSAQFTSDDNSIPENGAIARWNSIGPECHNVLGTELQILETMASKIESAGFVDVTETLFKWPIGSWPRNPRLKEIGKIAAYFVNTGLENWTLRLLTSVLNWQAEDVYLLCAGVREEMKSRNVHPIQKMRVVYGKKPGF